MTVEAVPTPLLTTREYEVHQTYGYQSRSPADSLVSRLCSLHRKNIEEETRTSCLSGVFSESRVVLHWYKWH